MTSAATIDDVFDAERNVDTSDAMASWDFDPFRTVEDCLAKIRARMAISTETQDRVRKAVDTIDPDEHARFLAEHVERLQSFDPLGPLKYAEIPYWAFRNVLLAEWLGLHRAAPRQILDIGMGSGSFAMVAGSMGHQVVGTDVADPWYDELCRLARVDRREAPVVRNEPYPVAGGPFDLVTIMLPAFHRRRTADGSRLYWTVEDWHAFLRDQVERNLKAGGQIFILMPLDKREDGRLTYSPLLEWAARRGARLGRTFESAPVRHILFERPAEQLA